jgi:hypothetical protein
MITRLVRPSGCPPVRLILAAALAACAPRPSAPPIPSLFDPPEGRFVQVSSYDTTGGNRDRLEIAAGDSAVLLDLSGPGEIRRIWITVSSQDPDYLRRLALRMYWDDEREPSVNVPLGDFFGNGFDKRHYAALPMGVSSGGFYCYLPMPFAGRARIVVDNGTGQPVDAFYYNIGVVRLDRAPASARTLHAWWHRDPRTASATPHLALTARGVGAFVGLSLNAEGLNDELWFLEGDEIYHVDGAFAGQGTGTEDYFNGGWYFEHGEFAAPFHGVVVKDESRGRIAAYRWHLTDPVPFRDSIRVEIEHGHANSEVADYATVAYWYQTEPHDPLPPLPPASARRITRVKIPADAVPAESLTVASVAGARLVTVPVPRPDRYEVVVYPYGGPGLGRADFALRGGGETTADLNAPDSMTLVTPVSLGQVGAHLEVEVEIRDAEVPLPAAVQVRPVRRWADRWRVVGPFPNPRVLGTETSPAVDSGYAPERDPTLDAYTLGGGDTVRWTDAPAEADGQVRLNPHFAPNDWVAAYAQAFLYSPDAREVTLLLGADDAHVLWVNGERVSERQGRHISQPDEIAITVRVRAGGNRILLKVADLDGGWAFQLRAADPEGVLRWSTEQ